MESNNSRSLQKILLIFLAMFVIAILLAYHASATLNTQNLMMYHDFDNNDLTDRQGRYNGTNTGTINTSGILGDARYFDGTDDIIDIGNSEATLNTTRTINMWLNVSNDDGAEAWAISKWTTNNANRQLAVMYSGADNFFRVYTDGSAGSVSTDTVNVNEWYMVTAVFNSSGMFVYLNGVLNDTDTNTMGSGTLVGMDYGHNTENGNTHWEGGIDEVSLWNESLTPTDILNLYSNGTACLYEDLNDQCQEIAQNESVERTTQVEQGPGFVQISSTSYQNITTGIVEVDVNTDSSYVTSTLETQGIGNGGATCRILVDGVDYGTNVTRSISSGNYGSWYLSSTNFTSTVQNHTITLQCKRDTAGTTFRVRNANLILHWMIDEQNETVNSKTIAIEESFSNSDYALILSNNFTVTTANQSNHIKYLLTDLNLEYGYNTTGNISIMAELNGQNCSEIPRYGLTDSFGSVGLFCTARNVTTGNVDFRLFAKGTGNITGNAFLKEFELDTAEVNFTGLNSTSITSSSFQDLASINLNNIDHTEAALIVKASIPTISNDGSAEATYRLSIATENGTQIQRSISTANQPGVTILQDAFKGLGTGAVTVTLEGLCDNSNCSIVGGDLIAYFSDTQDFISSGFNVTLYDQFNNSAIQDFNVTISNGNVFSTTEGIVEIFASASPENLTLAVTDYLGRTIVNHDITTNLNASMRQAEVHFDALELITNTNLSGVTFYVGTLSGTDFNLTAGTHTVTAEKAGYYNLSQNVTVAALFQGSINITGMYNGLANVTVINGVDNSTISNFTITTNHSSSYSTTNGTIHLPLLQNVTTGLNISGPSIASLIDQNITVNQSSQAVNFTVWAFNSIRVNIFNESSMTPLLQSVTVHTISNLSTFSNVTSTGFVSLNLLTPNEYELRFESSGFNPRSIFLTVTNDSTQNITIYMTENATTELQRIEVLDTANQPVEGAVVWLQKERLNESERWITIQESQTDYSGSTTVFVERDVTIFYRFAVIYEGEARPIQPSGNLFTGPTIFIPGVDETIQLIIDLEDNPEDFISDDLAISFDCNMTNTSATCTIIDGRNSITGAELRLEASYINESLNYESIQNVSFTGSSGTLTVNLTNVNNSIWRASAFVLYEDSENLIWEDTITFDIDVIVEKNTGLLYAIIVLAVVFGLTVTWGPLPSGIVGVCALIPLTAIKLISLPVGFITGLLALVVIFFFRTRKLDE